MRTLRAAAAEHRRRVVARRADDQVRAPVAVEAEHAHRGAERLERAARTRDAVTSLLEVIAPRGE